MTAAEKEARERLQAIANGDFPEVNMKKKGGSEMKRTVYYKAAKKHTLNIMASGLTSDEIRQIEALVKKITRKRSHEKRPQLLYDMIFND